MISCQHCGKPISSFYNYEVAWCQSCINKDWALLVKYGAVTPSCIPGEFNLEAFYWGEPNNELVRKIPTITLRDVGDMPAQEDDIEGVVTSVIIPPPVMCKRIYYGIECSCQDCSQESIIKLPEANLTFCKKRYYGIACDCGACPEPRQRRYR